MTDGVYEGLRVLDLTTGIAGPMTTMVLADNGADVTRIEGPCIDPFREQTGARVWNRGKRSAVIDLTSTEGRAAFDTLVASADIVVESLSRDAVARLGIEHTRMSAGNPRLITCSISGYGPLHELRDRPAYDALVAARTGLFYDQKGRRGTPMAFIAGRPGPH
ncbi:MAG: CoA transferase, partial [Ilumatobacteraceae bacterium]|nr:CoA transferase [Ilumatobacteraceae bacterium]